MFKKKVIKEMWDALTKIYQNNYQGRKMVLRDKLHNTRMSKGEGVTFFFTKITQLPDEMATIGQNYA